MQQTKYGKNWRQKQSGRKNRLRSWFLTCPKRKRLQRNFMKILWRDSIKICEKYSWTKNIFFGMMNYKKSGQGSLRKQAVFFSLYRK
ncbi:MAG: hypothetical protein HFI31_05505 [Lachnospiraceae bacterium]|nr:hypothetical protein [Lachnospiraceae bacterium]